MIKNNKIRQKIRLFFNTYLALLIIFNNANALEANSSRTKKFVIIVSAYNNQKYYNYNLNSIFSQTYNNFRVIYIDNNSEDQSFLLVKKYIKDNNLSAKINLIKNDKKEEAIYNYYKAIKTCDDHEIIICLDGSNWFANDLVLELYNNIHQDNNIWLTYAKFNNWPKNIISETTAYPNQIIENSRFRSYKYLANQGQSFYAWLAKKVMRNDLIKNDLENKSLIIPMLEMAGQNHKFIDQITIQKNNLINKSLENKLEIKNKYKKINTSNDTDLSIVGYIYLNDGIGKIPINFFDLLSDEIKINFINTRQQLNKEGLKEKDNLILENLSSSSKIAIYTDIIWHNNTNYINFLPASKIKIAYSMFEATKIPKEWVKNLNNKFDMVIVPDKFLVEVYQKSGVKIPVFKLPLPVILEDILSFNKNRTKNKEFVFGCCAANEDRKNLEFLIKTFHKTFKNSKEVKLIIQSKIKRDSSCKELVDVVKELNCTNVAIINNELAREEYLKVLNSFDCYVLISKAEGFSITPREALAMKKPCILSNNTAHKKMCAKKYAYGVKSEIKESAYYNIFGKDVGYNFAMKEEDLKKAFLELYNNYDQYLSKAEENQKWVKKYLAKNLKFKYLNLVKPKKIILGPTNKITNDYLMTNSKKLYLKYNELSNLEPTDGRTKKQML